MNPLINMVISTGPSKLTVFTRLWLGLQVAVSLSAALFIVLPMHAGFQGTALLLAIYVVLFTGVTALPVLAICAVIFVVFGGLTR